MKILPLRHPLNFFLFAFDDKAEAGAQDFGRGEGGERRHRERNSADDVRRQRAFTKLPKYNVVYHRMK